jgi:pyruvate-formate lyase-activating enzyme
MTTKNSSGSTFEQDQTNASSSASNQHTPPLAQGIQAFNTGDFAAAIDHLSVAITQEPGNPMPLAYLAFIAVHQGRLPEARNFIARCEHLAPEKVGIKAAFGETLLKANHPEMAVDYLTKAIGKQPDLYAAYPVLAQSLHRAGRSEEAVAILQPVAVIVSSAQADIRETLRAIRLECCSVRSHRRPEHPMKYCSYLFNDINFMPDAIQPCCDVLALGVPRYPFTGGEMDMQAYNRHIHQTLTDLQTSNKSCAGCQHLQEIMPCDLSSVTPRFRSVSINMHRNRCNCRCVYCPQRNEYFNSNDSYDILPPLKSLHEQNALLEGCFFSWGGGESTILKEFEEASMWIAHQKQRYWQHVHTSALRFSPAIAELLKNGRGSINVSLDSSSEKTYEAVKGVDGFDRVMKNLGRYIEAAQDKSAVQIKYIFFSTNNNPEEVVNFCMLCYRLGIKKIQFSFDFRDARNNSVSDDSLRAAIMLCRITTGMGITHEPFFIGPDIMARMRSLAQQA